MALATYVHAFMKALTPEVYQKQLEVMAIQRAMLR
jgi:hypothetical protein